MTPFLREQILKVAPLGAKGVIINPGGGRNNKFFFIGDCIAENHAEDVCVVEVITPPGGTAHTATFEREDWEKKIDLNDLYVEHEKWKFKLHFPDVVVTTAKPAVIPRGKPIGDYLHPEYQEDLHK